MIYIYIRSTDIEDPIDTKIYKNIRRIYRYNKTQLNYIVDEFIFDNCYVNTDKRK